MWRFVKNSCLWHSYVQWSVLNRELWIGTSTQGQIPSQLIDFAIWSSRFMICQIYTCTIYAILVLIPQNLHKIIGVEKKRDRFINGSKFLIVDSVTILMTLTGLWSMRNQWLNSHQSMISSRRHQTSRRFSPVTRTPARCGSESRIYRYR